jgi:hypothetical protein
MMGQKFWVGLATKLGIDPSGTGMIKSASNSAAAPVEVVPVPNRIALHEARLAGFFKLAKPMGWGIYRTEDIDGGLGSIWRIEKDAETGGQFLVKQVDPEGEVLRKTASTVYCSEVGCNRVSHGSAPTSMGGRPFCDLHMPKKETASQKWLTRVAVAPPGEEKLVKKLKKEPDVDNPFAVAWSIYNKKKKASADTAKCPECGQEIGLVNGKFVTHGNNRGSERETTKNSPCLGSGTRARYMEDARGRHPIPEGGDWGKKAADLSDNEPEETLDEMAQLIREIAFDTVRASLVPDFQDVEEEVAAWFQSSYGTEADRGHIRDMIKQHWAKGEEEAWRSGRRKQAAAGNQDIASRLVQIRKDLEYGSSDDAREALHSLSLETPGALGRKINLVYHRMEKDTEQGIDEMSMLFDEIGGNRAEWDAALEEPGDEQGTACQKCGVQTGGTKLCLNCSPQGTMFKKPEGGSMHGPVEGSASKKAAVEEPQNGSAMGEGASDGPNPKGSIKEFQRVQRASTGETGIVLKVNDQKPGDIDVLVLWDKPHEGYDVFETDIGDIVAAGEEATPEQVAQAKAKLEEHLAKKEKYESDFQDKIKGGDQNEKDEHAEDEKELQQTQAGSWVKAVTAAWSDWFGRTANAVDEKDITIIVKDVNTGGGDLNIKPREMPELAEGVTLQKDQEPESKKKEQKSEDKSEKKAGAEKCPTCGKPMKENTDGNPRYCQGHD